MQILTHSFSCFSSDVHDECSNTSTNSLAGERGREGGKTGDKCDMREGGGREGGSEGKQEIKVI